MNGHSHPRGTHWLYRPETLPKLWRGGIVVLALSVAAEVFVNLHPHFGFAHWFAFNAFYGFFTCLAMVVFAKWLGGLVKRPDDYYADPDEAPSAFLEQPIEEEQQ
jgi:hypothetical protein